VEERDRVVQLLGTDLLDAQRLRQPGEEFVQRGMGDRAAQARVGLRIDRARADDPLQEPDRGAVGEGLELRDAEGPAVPKLVEH
jgi:hypothetical protein